MFLVFVLLLLFIVICYKLRLFNWFLTLIRECYFYIRFHVYRDKLLRTMNSAGEKDNSTINFIESCFVFSAFNLAASMFESSAVDANSLAAADTDLYILRIKYRTSNDMHD